MLCFMDSLSPISLNLSYFAKKRVKMSISWMCKAGEMFGNMKPLFKAPLMTKMYSSTLSQIWDCNFEMDFISPSKLKVNIICHDVYVYEEMAAVWAGVVKFIASVSNKRTKTMWLPVSVFYISCKYYFNLLSTTKFKPKHVQYTLKDILRQLLH